MNDTRPSVPGTTRALLDYCRRNDWAGYDPYDALNSRLLAVTPLGRSRHMRILLTQVMKRLPVNIRPLLLIKKEQNAKAMALFVMALLKMSDGAASEPDPVAEVARRIEELRSPGTRYWCWGYSFPWQTRKLLVPRGAPNLVCTTFVATALLDLYEARNEPKHLEMATSAGEYITRELYWEAGGAAGFSYPMPGDQTRVHNANLLAAALLFRIDRHRGTSGFSEMALNAARYSVRQQHHDGSWAYGESPTQQWVDNFHTGYNLCALRTIESATGSSEFTAPLVAGFRFYRTHFVTADGVAKYFHNRTQPIDIHSVAQSIITLVMLRDLAADTVAMAARVLEWALDHMWDGRGYFYYRYGAAGPVRISYMRWSQAWMLLALATWQSERLGGAPPGSQRLELAAAATC
jgi:hypothetical protein